MAILTNQTSDTTSSGVSHTSQTAVHVTGTFDGATVTIEVSLDDSAYVKADNTAGEARLTVPGVVPINHPGSYYIRASVLGAKSSTNITVKTTQPT